MNDFLPNFPYYETDLLPFYSRFWATFAHFDGVHYLRIAERGYTDLASQAFFPLYPLLTRVIGIIPVMPLYRAIAISILALIFCYYALRQLFPKSPRLFWLLLFFPTAFYLPMVYTESLFLALSLWFFVFLSRRNYTLAIVLAALASATRLPGLFLAFSLALSLMRAHQPLLRVALYSMFASSGLILYMLYLGNVYHDPLLFLHVQPVFGANRSGGELVLLPQVLYRYLRMFLTVDYHTWIFQRAVLEFGFFAWGIYIFFSRIRTRSLPVNTYLLGSLLLPTLTGTLSSFPRYLLVLAPWLLPVSSVGRRLYILVSLPLFVWLCYLYSQGQFVS